MELFNGKLCLIWIICATKDYLKHKLKAAMLLKLRESYQSDKINDLFAILCVMKSKNILKLLKELLNEPFPGANLIKVI